MGWKQGSKFPNWVEMEVPHVMSLQSSGLTQVAWQEQLHLASTFTSWVRELEIFLKKVFGGVEIKESLQHQ